MISLPAGFDAALLFSDLYSAAAPMVGIAMIVASGFLIVRIFKGCS